MRLPPVVAAFAGSPELLPAVAEAVAVTQNTSAAVAFGCAAARILEACILGASPAEAAAAAVAALRDPDRVFPLDLDGEIAAALEAAAHVEASHFEACHLLGKN